MPDGMYDCANVNEELLDREEVRGRLRRMSDDKLRQWGAAARHLCSPEANFGKPPRQNFVIQLEEAIAEWKRCHGPGAPQTSPGGPPLVVARIFDLHQSAKLAVFR